jgi:hypothetical protein
MGGTTPVSWRRALPASLVLAVIVLTTGKARADEAALNWVRLQGAEACISAPKLAALVEQRIGRPVLQTPTHADLSIEAHVGPQPSGGFIVVVTVHGRDGAKIGQRELRVAQGPCSQLDRPASLIISLIIDPDAAGPGLMEGGSLSPVAQQLLTQIDLPSGDPDELLASLDFTPAPARRDLLAASAYQTPALVKHQGASPPIARAAAPPAKMVSVREEEWLRLQTLRREQSEPEAPSGPTPRWPGYALLGLSAAAAGTATLAIVRLNDLNDDATFTSYRAAVAPNVSDACAAARDGATFGLDPSVVSHARDVCAEGNTMEVLFWTMAGTTLASAAVGTAWLLWIADDDPEPAGRASASISVAPSFVGAQLRIQL